MRPSRAAQTQLGLLAISFGLAWVWPVPTLLWSYAVLGPAHYLTELEWLRQRRFFIQGTTQGRWAWAAAMAAITAIGCAVPGAWPLCILLALSVALAVAVAGSASGQAALASTLLLGLAILAAKAPTTWIILAIWLPTILHVGVFTVAFIARGAVRTDDLSFTWVVLALVLGAWACAHSLGTVQAPANAVTTLVRDLSVHLTSKGAYRMLAFIYLFHYLNWGSKTRLLGWRRGTAQLWVLGALWSGSVGLYLWRYEVGLRAQLFLSLLHVVLELPLNAATFLDLWRAIVGCIIQFPPV